MSNEDTSPSPEALEPAAKPAPRRKTAAFRHGLIAKLPRLAVTSWQAQDADDVYEEMHGITSLDADAFLQPLERLAEKKNA